MTSPRDPEARVEPAEEAAQPEADACELPAAKPGEQRREYDALYDKYLRLLADFDNYKKRTSKEWEQHLQFANEQLLQGWLPVVDNMERAVKHAKESKAPAAVVDGWALILKQAQDLLARAGATPIESVGRPFNPELHQAIAQRESGDAEDGAVLEDVQRGYLLNGRLLRPAQVIVAKRA